MRILLDHYLNKNMKNLFTPSQFRVSLLFILIALLITTSSYAQDEVQSIETDRPDQTEAASVIPVKTLQLEAGYFYQKDEQSGIKQENLAYPTALLRLGILSWLELRVQSAWQQDNLVHENGLKTKVNGFGPLTLGAKAALWQEKGIRPQAAAMLMVDLPVGSRNFRPEEPETEARLMFKNSLTDWLDLNYNLAYTWTEDLPEQSYAVSLGAGLTERITVYAEAFGNKSKGHTAEHLADAGLLFLVLPNLQLDVAAGKALNSAAPDFFVTTGFSLRLPH